jgi:hypothetical protein
MIYFVVAAIEVFPAMIPPHNHPFFEAMLVAIAIIIFGMGVEELRDNKK